MGYFIWFLIGLAIAALFAVIPGVIAASVSIARTDGQPDLRRASIAFALPYCFFLLFSVLFACGTALVYDHYDLAMSGSVVQAKLPEKQLILAYMNYSPNEAVLTPERTEEEGFVIDAIAFDQDTTFFHLANQEVIEDGDSIYFLPEQTYYKLLNSTGELIPLTDDEAEQIDFLPTRSVVDDTRSDLLALPITITALLSLLLSLLLCWLLRKALVRPNTKATNE